MRKFAETVTTTGAACFATGVVFENTDWYVFGDGMHLVEYPHAGQNYLELIHERL